MSKTQYSGNRAKSPLEILRRAAGEWLRDADEVSDLLTEFGGTPDGDVGSNRAQLLKILESLEPERVATLLYGLARGFALMLDDIGHAADRWQVSIVGELRPSESLPLGPSALDTSWVHASDGEIIDLGGSRITALGGRLLAVVSALSVTTPLPARSVRRPNQFGEALADSPNPVHSVILGMQTDLTHSSSDRTTPSRGDLQALADCVRLLTKMRSLASSLGNGGLTGAVSEALGRVHQIVAKLNQAGSDNTLPTGRALQLVQEIREIESQLAAVARGKGHAKRAAQGLGTFSRSELWASRWRVFEVWILIRCMQAVERTGFELELIDVRDGVWNLRYGRTSEPIARFRSSTSSLELFYQLFEKGDAAAAMPDIALRDTQGHYIFVVDPKHGPSHNRSSVQKVLNRYATQFKATVTAVVNYTRMPSYRHEVLQTEHGLAILSSGVTPRSSALRRLELRLEDAVLSQLSVGDEVSTPSEIKFRRRRRVSSLVYWATAANEVDEPAGAWVLARGSVLNHLAKLTSAVGAQSKVTDIVGSPNGSTAILTTEDSLIFATEVGHKRILQKATYNGRLVGWCNCGRHVLIVNDLQCTIYNSDGTVDRKLPDLTERPEAVAWSSTCDCIYVVDGTARLRSIEYDTSATIWENASSNPYVSGEPCVFFDRRTSRNLIVFDRKYEVRWGHISEGVEPRLVIAKEGLNAPWAITPSGDKVLERGPKSITNATLFRVNDASNSAQIGPLIRTFAAPKGKVSWSLDGERFAFRAHRELYVGVPGEKYGMSIALPRHAPCGFAWMNAQFLEHWL